MVNDKPLQGKIAVVTGASRGIGRGIALSLGEAGATVYVVARSGVGQPSGVPLAGTVDETAAEITQSGGTGIAARCDLRDDAATEALFARIQQEQGRLDILVNSAWAGYEGFHDDTDTFPAPPFWERALTFWDLNLSGLRAAYTCSVLAAWIMTARQSGLIVCVSHYIGEFGNPAYHLAKTGTDRLVAEMGHGLREQQVAVVALYPGLVRTEGILKHAQYMDLSNSESPQFTGRAVVALAADPAVLTRTGSALWVSDLATAYGFTDLDGRVLVPTWKPAQG